MFYQPHEKLIYSPPDSEKKYDPLAIERELIKVSKGDFDNLYNTWVSVNDDTGDVSVPKSEKSLASAIAEEQLVKIGRVVFQLPDFPECLDATVLEYLTDYIGWMEGKGQRAIII